MVQDEIKIQFTGEASGLNKTLGDVKKGISTVTDAWEEADSAAKKAEKTVSDMEKSGRKNTEEWAKAKKAAESFRTAADQAAASIKKTDIAAMSLDQLEKYYKSADQAAKSAEKTVVALEKAGKKGSDEWAKAKKEALEYGKAADTAAAAMKKVDVSAMNMNQLENYIKKATKEVKTLTEGTDAFNKKTAEIQAAKTRYDQLKSVVNGTAAELEKTRKAADAANKELLETKNSELTFGRLKEKVALMRAEIEKMPRGTAEFKKAVAELSASEKQLAEVSKEINGIKKGGEDLGSPGLWGKITSGIGGIKAAFLGFFALQVVQFFWDIGKAIFETTGKFEKYETTLTAMLGSQEKAKSSMQALKDIAAKTPFSLDELTNSYIKMTARGLRPSEEQLLRMGDAAAKMGKPFDSLMEAVLDVSNTERWNEIGIKVSKVGDKIKTNIGGSTQYFDATEKGAMEMAVAFGSTTDAMGLMEKQSGTLSGRVSSIGDVMQQIWGIIGERLMPVFKALLDVVGNAVQFFKEMWENSTPLTVAFGHLWASVEQLYNIFGDLILSIFPGLKNQTLSAGGVMQVFGGIVAGVSIILKAAVTWVQALIDIYTLFGKSVVGIGQLVKMAFEGDFSNMGKVWDGVKDQFSKTGDHIKANWKSIQTTFKDAFVDYPKKEGAAGILDVTNKTTQATKELTDTQKKELEKRAKEADRVRKAELKAIDDSYRQQQEALIANIDNELKREQAKVDLKYELLRRQAEREKKDKGELKTVLKELEIQHTAELEEVGNKHLQKVAEANKKALQQIAELEAEAQINRISDDLLREEAKITAKKVKRIADINATLADEAHKDKLRKAAEDEALAEIERKREEHRKKELEKEEKNLQKQLEYRKNIINQKQQAEMALFDFQEIQAKHSASKLAQIHKDRVDRELYWTKEKLKAEEDAELHKATLTLKAGEELTAAQKAISDRYRNAEIAAEAEASEKKKKIDQDLVESRAKSWGNASNAIQALLKGDLTAFADYTNQIFQGEQQGWQKRLSAHMAGYEAIAGMATQAVQFLNQLSQQRLQTEMDNLAKETAAKVEAVNAQKNAVIEGIRAEEQAELDRLRREYLATQVSATDVEAIETALAAAKQDVNTRYQVWMDSARAAGNAAELERLDTERREELKKVEDTVLANQLGAVKLRENEQSLTDQKQSINAQYKAWMDEARAAGNAAELARLENELAAEQAKLSSSVMSNQMTADQLNAMEAQLAAAKQDTNARYKAWMDAARAAGNAAELARLESELAAELVKVDETIRGNELGTATLQKMEQDLATKKTSINTKYNAEITKKTKETANDIGKIQNDAAVKERELKLEQWKQQKKADTATAIIQGSIAALKALASGFFPVNLVFAGIIAGMTAIQVAKIQNQPTPTFAKGGFVAQGGKHGARYGDGGIALIDRSSGREVGEMEGDEAIISADQTAANWGLIQEMFKNARDPKLRRKPVSSGNRPMAFRDGGQLFESPYFKKEMYLFGSKKRKAEEQARQAEEQARAAQEQADAEAAALTAQYSSGSVEGGPDAEAAYADAQAQGQKQLDLLQGIVDSTEANGAKLDALAGAVGSVRDAVNGNTGATYSVRDAVYGAVGDMRNQVIAALSSFGG